MTSGSAVEVGQSYLITWRGQQHLGEVVDRRSVKRKGSEPEEEFYVHYCQFDRRLDEWVSADKIDTSRTFSGTESGILNYQSSRHRKFKRREEKDERDERESLLSAFEKENENITRMKNIQSIVLGKYEIETWYFAPYPEEYSGVDKMYICEYCLKYMKKQRTLVNHAFKCHMHSPPGKQIYLENNLSMFEIDGKDHKLYCQNLCLLSKLFLDHKTLYYDVDPFLFYVLCEVDEHQQHHIVGYFSKEKQSQENYNLACILTFPPYQRMGYGKFLISVSYELSKREGTVGSPEKPLSDLGRISYRSYWAFVILNIFADKELLKTTSIDRLSRMTGIRVEDILSTLHSLNMIKYWKGQHVISVNAALVENVVRDSKRIRLCDPACLTWQPPDKLLRAKS